LFRQQLRYLARNSIRYGENKTMLYKPVFLQAAVTLTMLNSAAIKASPPLSYSEIINAERERMVTNYKNQGGDAVRKQHNDDTWLTNTTGTWSYIINKERLRMKAIPSQSKAEPSVSKGHSKSDLMPTTLNEGVRLQHEQMQDRSKNKY
jgi:hypothetical protein